MNATAPDDSLFSLYGQIGLPWPLLALTTLRTLISTLGILLNASVLFVTFKSKSLDSPCHLLIAFESAASGWFQMGAWVGMAIQIGGLQFVPIRLCCLQLLPIFICGFYAALSANLLISADRLLCLLFPIWYGTRQLSLKYSFFLCSLCALLYPAFILQLIFRIVQTVPEKNRVMCAPHECIWSWASDQNYLLNSSINGLSVLNYVLIWALLKWRTTQNGQSAAALSWTRQIFKALAILMALNLAGHTLNSIVRLILPLFLKLPTTQSAILTFSLSCLTNLALASNAPVLFAFNQEYRRAFRAAFRLKFVNSSTTFPLPPITGSLALASRRMESHQNY